MVDYTFRITKYEGEEKVTREFSKDFGGYDPKPAEAFALDLWKENFVGFTELEVTGPFYYSTDWFRLTLKREAGNVGIKV